MKILVLGSRIPYPLHDGGAIATYQMLRSMAAAGEEITFFSYNTKKHYNSEAEIKQAFRFCEVIPNYLDTDTKWYKALYYLFLGKNYNMVRFNDKAANRKLELLLKEKTFDILHFEGLYATPFLATAMANSAAFRALRQHNVEHRIWATLARKSGVLKGLYFRFLAKGLKKYETEMLKWFDVVLPISRIDELEMQVLTSDVPFYYYPAGIDIRESKTVVPNNPFSISHIGSMEWRPNVQAVQWFIKEVWPRILHQFPNATFHIAGKALDKNDPRFVAHGVVNHGEVDDALKFQNEHAIAVVPIASGSGLRMKTLEAMALSKPVISTSVGADGIPYKDRENILIANTVEDWINDISMLFEDTSFARRIGENARKLTDREFSIQSHTRALLDFYRQNIK
jgi:glycosyltransferase involved in cell wall biosynthesis